MVAHQIFVNLPVKDLEKSIQFFTALGFTFNKKFTDEKATCMIIGENIFAMLIVEKYFKTFTTKEISDAEKTTEVITALSVESREKVDKLVDKAMAAGAHFSNEVSDYGWMYTRNFQSPAHHLSAIFFM